MRPLNLFEASLLVILIIALTIWGMVRLERRKKISENDPTIFRTSASIEGAQGTISDIEFGARLEALTKKAKSAGCKGLDVAWLNRAGEQVNRTVIDFTR